MKARVAAIVSILCLSTYAMAADPSSDAARLQGTWRGRSPEGANLELVIQGSASKSTVAGKAGTFVVEQEFKLDETTDPKGIDFLPPAAKPGDKADGKPTPGIYKLEGDRLTVCLNVFGDKRPTKFAAGKDGGQLVVYSRVGPKTGTGSTAGAAAGPLAPLQGRWEGWTEVAGKREDITVEVDGATLTLSKGKGADAKPVGKSQIKLVDAAGSKQVRSKGIDFAPADARNADELKGVGLYQMAQDLKSWMIALRPDGTKRPEKVDAAGSRDAAVETITLLRPAGPPTTQPAETGDKPKLPPRRPTPSRRPAK